MSEGPETSGGQYLRRMFSDVSSEYDVLNRLLTFGMDRRWRDRAVKLCNPRGTVLDLCCGTGKMLFAIRSFAGDASNVVGVDFSPEMVDLAGAGGPRPFLLADAACLPFRAESFDCVATAFSFRNLLYKNPGFEGYIGEVLRILRRGGRFLVLETSQPERRTIRKLYHLYLRNVVHLVGGLVSGNRRAYRYLHLSALNHPPPEEVSARLTSLGFQHVEFTPLSFGIVGIHMATK